MSATERADEFGVVDDLPAAPTALDYLREVMAERRAEKVRVVKLRDTASRPELLLTCRVPHDAQETAQIMKAAEAEEKKKNSPPGALILACMTLARMCSQVSLNGRDLAPGDGAAFAYPPVQEALEVTGAWRAVRALFDDDFAVVRVYEELMRSTGIGGTVDVSDDEDPT